MRVARSRRCACVALNLRGAERRGRSPREAGHETRRAPPIPGRGEAGSEGLPWPPSYATTSPEERPSQRQRLQWWRRHLGPPRRLGHAKAPPSPTRRPGAVGSPKGVRESSNSCGRKVVMIASHVPPIHLRLPKVLTRPGDPAELADPRGLLRDPRLPRSPVRPGFPPSQPRDRRPPELQRRGPVPGLRRRRPKQLRGGGGPPPLAPILDWPASRLRAPMCPSPPHRVLLLRRHDPACAVGPRRPRCTSW